MTTSASSIDLTRRGGESSSAILQGNGKDTGSVPHDRERPRGHAVRASEVVVAHPLICHWGGDGVVVDEAPKHRCKGCGVVGRHGVIRVERDGGRRVGAQTSG